MSSTKNAQRFVHRAAYVITSIVLVAMTAPAAQAADCNALVAELGAYLAGGDGSGVPVVGASVQTFGKASTWTRQPIPLRAIMGSVPLSQRTKGIKPPLLGLEGRRGLQYFSDRPNPDSLGVRIITGKSVRVSLILESWGNVLQSGDARCTPNTMTGRFDKDTTTFRITFSKWISR